VAAIKMVDEAEGSALAPADWVSTQPVIKNSRAGILEYYQEKYEDKTQEAGLWLSVKKLLGGHVQSSRNSTDVIDSKSDKEAKMNEVEKSGKNGKIGDLKKKSVEKEAKIDAPEKSAGKDCKNDDLKKKSVIKEAKIDAPEKSVGQEVMMECKTKGLPCINIPSLNILKEYIV